MKRKSKKPQDQQDDTAIVQSIAFTLLFKTRVVQAISSDVTVGQAYVGRRGLTEETEEI